MADLTEQFLDLIWKAYRGTAELRTLDAEGVMSQHFFLWPKEKNDILLTIASLNGYNDIFGGVLLRTGPKGDAAHCRKETEWLWADVDKKKGVTFGSILRRLMPIPQIIVDSGHGWHLYWHLDRPVPTDVATGAMKVLAETLGGDIVGDPARIMRIPGTLNLKDGKAVPVRIIKMDDKRRLRFSDFDLPAPPERDRIPVYTVGELWELSDEDAPKFGEGERNRGLTSLAGAMLIKGMDSEEMLIALRAENEVRCLPPLPDREVQSVCRSVLRYR